MPTCSTVEAHHGNGKQRPPTVALVPNLEPQELPLQLALLHLLPRGEADLTQFCLEGRLLNRTAAQSSQGQLGSLLPAVGHEPPGAFGEEDERDRLDRRCNEEECKGNPVGVLARHMMCPIVHCCTYNGPDAELRLVYGEHDATQMCRRCFVDVHLAESEEPAHGYAFLFYTCQQKHIILPARGDPVPSKNLAK